MSISNLFSILMAILALIGSYYGIRGNLVISAESIVESSRTKFGGNKSILTSQSEAKADSIISFVYYMLSAIFLFFSNWMLYFVFTFKLMLSLIVIFITIITIFLILYFVRSLIFNRLVTKVTKLNFLRLYNSYLKDNKISSSQINHDRKYLSENNIVKIPDSYSDREALSEISKFLDISIPDSFPIK